VPGRVSLIPFNLCVRDNDSCSHVYMRTSKRPTRALIGDDSHVVVALDLVAVGPVRHKRRSNAAARADR
jgi:hypothetical protein